MNDRGLLARACDSVERYQQLGCETFAAHGAVLVRNHATPSRYDANHVGLVRSEGTEIDALLRQAEIEYRDIGYVRFDTDPLTPPQVEARLALEGGFTRSEGLVLVLEADLRATPRPVEIREVNSDEDWQAYSELLRLDLAEDAARHGRAADLSVMPDFLRYLRAKAPAVRTWLARAEGKACGFFSSWPGENGVGQVEDLFTHPDFRHRGIATALIARCVADARLRGADAVLIAADPDDTPKHMYAAMGFRPLFLARTYRRAIA